MFETLPLSRDAREVMRQLFVHGPTWDGNLVSKHGRESLIDLGLAFYHNGISSLTREGIDVAVELGKKAKNPIWRLKAENR